MSAILLFGFLLGVRHALEADHVAAVAALATRSSRLRDTVKIAASWSTGHAVALVLLGSVLVALGASVPEHLARSFEGMVGLVLAGLGVDVLRRLWVKRVHFHVHEHDDAGAHLHAHAHEQGIDHGRDPHRHEHPAGLLGRSLAVGGLHGLAGTGALVLLSMQEAGSPGGALAYLCCFAIGSVIGMVAFSVAISFPLRLSARWLGRTAGGIEAGLGLVSIVLGSWIVARSAGF